LSPRPFRDEDGTFFLTRAPGEGRPEQGYLRSIAAAGEPSDARGRGLLVAGVWAPQPFETRIAWAVHLDALASSDPCWHDRWEPRTLETVARPVLAIPIATAAGARWVLSLWHDRRLLPWPAPDPFARGPRFAIDEVLGTAALDHAVERRRALEDRRVIALGASGGPDGTSFLALYGAPGTEEVLSRRFVTITPGDEAPASTVSGPEARAAPEAPEHPLDAWALHHMRRIGARHGQMAIVRGRRLAFARAYTYAEAGYPVARLDDAMRLGSVSKALTAAALFPALERAGIREGVDARAADLLGVRPGEGRPLLAAVSLRHLLTHDAGLGSFVDLRPDDPRNPLSEHRLTELLDSVRAAARPGRITEALGVLGDEVLFARAPGGGRAAGPAYSNEGFMLLGEILARLAQGRADAYEEAAVSALLRPAGVDPEGRGCLLGAGRKRARERREAPAHASSPTWVEKRFTGDDLDEGPLVPAPYGDNGPFLGGAAGWCVPLVWLARVFAALGPRGDGTGLWRRRHADLAATPAAPRSALGHGFHLGEPAFWTFRPSAPASTGAPSTASLPAPPLTIRVVRIHHNGRVEGGSALLIHQMPQSARDDALDATLTVAVAFNQLGPLHAVPHGRELLAIVRGLEVATATAGTTEAHAAAFREQDLFDRL
jgi:CubicO group peptidase (beta-lactamase class C family)